MPDTYVVQPNDSLWSIAKKFNVPFQELKNLNPALGSRIPPYGINKGDVVKLRTPPPPNSPPSCGKCQPCVTHRLAKPFLIATAVDSTIVPRVSLKVNDDVLRGNAINLGQDMTFATGRTAPDNKSVGTDENALRNQMGGLLNVFAKKDPHGKAKQLFEEFLKKRNEIHIFTSPELDKTIRTHANFIAFSDRTLAAPGTQGTDPNKLRIHQGLKGANWDINQVQTITDLKVLAFNEGSKFWSTGDFANGLGLMINGVQYVFVYVDSYDYRSCNNRYIIRLKFVLYDVFGLDDDDVREFGSSSTWGSAAGRGITAWWQLQHQFNYAPLLTRAVAYRTFVVNTLGQ